MASMAWMDIGGGYHGYHTYFNYGHSTAQIRYGPRGIDASSEHEPGPAQRRTSPSVVSHALTEPHPGSDSVLQQMLAQAEPGTPLSEAILLISR